MAKEEKGSQYHGRFMGEHTHSHTNKNGDKAYGHTEQQAIDRASEKSNCR